MPHAATQTTTPADAPGTAPASLPNREKALRILSKSIYKELRQNGYEPKQIVALATELISEVTNKIRGGQQATAQVA
jgi:hypothetical protein